MQSYTLQPHPNCNTTTMQLQHNHNATAPWPIQPHWNRTATSQQRNWKHSEMYWMCHFVISRLEPYHRCSQFVMSRPQPRCTHKVWNWKCTTIAVIFYCQEQNCIATARSETATALQMQLFCNAKTTTKPQPQSFCNPKTGTAPQPQGVKPQVHCSAISYFVTTT